MVRVFAGIGLAVALLPTCVLAQVYTCTDKNGKFIISDRLLQACSDRPVKELDKRGMPVRDIAAPMTEAERKKQEDEDKRRLGAQAKEEDRARQDQALMARYKSEEDIAAARKKDLIQIDQRITDSDAAVAQAEKQLQAAQNETRQATGGSAAEAVQKRVKDAQLVIDEQKKLAAASRKEKAQINARYADTLTKFRAINAASNQQPATPSK